jgi:galactokinase
LKEEVVQAFRDRFGASPSYVVRSPGRVNLIGEHTDYNDGFVLPMAIDRAIWLGFRSRKDGRVRIDSIDQADPCDFALDDLRHTEAGWAEYPKGMTKMLQDAGHHLVGWDGVLTSELPMGSGLSSSAALEMAVGLAFATVSDFPFAGTEMARLGQRAENEWVGASTGIMDQMICANGESGSAMLIDCRDLSSESIALPEDVALLVMDTMTRHDHRTSGYGERRARCEAAASAFDVSHLRDLDLEAFESRRKGLDLDVASLRCTRHVVSENARVLEAAEAMRRADSTRLGLLMDASHDSLRDDFQVSNEALDTMVSIARAEPGCFGARMTGGGFGGCAIALVDQARAGEIGSVIAADYARATDRRPVIFSTKAAKGTAFA